MKPTTSVHFVALLVLALHEPASAEDLRLVGTIDPVSVKIYADRDSLSRRAHIATITTIAFPDPTSKRVDTLPFIFDCDEKVYHGGHEMGEKRSAVLDLESNYLEYVFDRVQEGMGTMEVSS